MQVQNMLNAMVLMAAALYCSLALGTMILNTLALQHASLLLWCVLFASYLPFAYQISKLEL